MTRPGPTAGKRAFLSTSMFGGWPCSYWPSYLNRQRAPCDVYNPPQLPALSHSCVHRDNCLLWVECECLSGGTHLSSFHTTTVKSPLVLTRVSLCFSLSGLGLKSLGMPFLCSLNVPQQKIFFWAKSSYRSGEEKKVVHVQFIAKSFYTPCQISHCIVCCCQVLCPPLSIFTEVYIHVKCISYSHTV